MMWDPIRFLESCPSSDGACAVVFTDEAGGKAAAADGRPPAWILGTAVRSEPSTFPGRDPVRPQGAVDCAGRRLRAGRHHQPARADRHAPSCTCRSPGTSRSGSRPTTSPTHGEGWKMVERGDTELDGSFPVNMSGGVLSSNPIGASGLLRFAEAALQVRGMAGEHQVDGAKVALGPGLRRQPPVLHHVGRRELASTRSPPDATEASPFAEASGPDRDHDGDERGHGGGWDDDHFDRRNRPRARPASGRTSLRSSSRAARSPLATLDTRSSRLAQAFAAAGVGSGGSRRVPRQERPGVLRGHVRRWPSSTRSRWR